MALRSSYSRFRLFLPGSLSPILSFRPIIPINFFKCPILLFLGCSAVPLVFVPSKHIFKELVDLTSSILLLLSFLVSTFWWHAFDIRILVAKGELIWIQTHFASFRLGWVFMHLSFFFVHFFIFLLTNSCSMMLDWMSPALVRIFLVLLCLTHLSLVFSFISPFLSLLFLVFLLGFLLILI